MQLVGAGLVVGNEGAALKHGFPIAGPSSGHGSVPPLPVCCASCGVLRRFYCCSRAFSLQRQLRKYQKKLCLPLKRRELASDATTVSCWLAH